MPPPRTSTSKLLRLSFYVITSSRDPCTGAPTASCLCTSPCSPQHGAPAGGPAACWEEADGPGKQTLRRAEKGHRRAGSRVPVLGSAEQGWWGHRCTRAQGRRVPLRGCGGLPGEADTRASATRSPNHCLGGRMQLHARPPRGRAAPCPTPTLCRTPPGPGGGGSALSFRQDGDAGSHRKSKKKWATPARLGETWVFSSCLTRRNILVLASHRGRLFFLFGNKKKTLFPATKGLLLESMVAP